MAKKPWEFLIPALDRASRWLARNGWLLGLPVAISLLAALGYIVFTEKSWRASQSIIVRDDLLGESFKPGRFNSQESLKNAQETVLYVARQPDVIAPALQKLGSPSGDQDTAWIDQDRIESEQSQISVIAPNGAEFGKTEVIVLNVRGNTAERAKTYATLLAQQIEQQLQQLRVKQLQGMQEELEQSRAQAQTRYDEVAEQVRRVETEVGSDLSTLRSMIDNSSSGNDVHRFLEQIRADTRVAQQELESIDKQLELLSTSDSWDETIPTSNQLLQMQPTLSRLYDGLAQAQLKASIEIARYTENHPTTQNHLLAIQETRQQIQSELATIKRGLDSQRSLAQQKLDRLLTNERDYEQRLTELGKRRVEYQVLTTELNKRGEALAKIKSSLFEIESLTNPQAKLSLLTLVGEPQVDSRPLGLSKSLILLAAFFGGLLIGLGVVVLVRDPSEWGAAIRWGQAITARVLAPTRTSGSPPSGSQQSAGTTRVAPGVTGYAPSVAQAANLPRPAATAPTAATSLLSSLMAASQAAQQAPDSGSESPVPERSVSPGGGVAASAPRPLPAAADENNLAKIDIEPQLSKQTAKNGSLRQAMGFRPYGAGRVNDDYQLPGPVAAPIRSAYSEPTPEPEVVEADPVLAAEHAARLSKFVGNEPNGKPLSGEQDSHSDLRDTLNGLAGSKPEISSVVSQHDEFRRVFESSSERIAPLDNSEALERTTGDTQSPALTEPETAALGNKKSQSQIDTISNAAAAMASPPSAAPAAAAAGDARSRRRSAEPSFTPTINLEELRKSFESAGLATTQTVPAASPSSPQPTPPITAPAVAPATAEATGEQDASSNPALDLPLPKLPLESAEINVAKRLSELSKSIAAYCEPVKKKNKPQT